MGVTTVNISFQSNLLSDIDRIARRESRSRSELLREAARLYVARKRRWGEIFRYGSARAEQGKLAEADVAAEIRTHRRERAGRK